MQRYSKMEGSYTSGQNSQSQVTFAFALDMPALHSSQGAALLTEDFLQEQAQSSSSIKDLLDKVSGSRPGLPASFEIPG